MYLQPVAEGIQLQDSPREVFHNLLQVVNQLYGGNDELLNDIGGDNDLINVSGLYFLKDIIICTLIHLKTKYY